MYAAGTFPALYRYATVLRRGMFWTWLRVEHEVKGSALRRRRWGATVCAVYRVLEKAKYMCEESGSGGVELIPAENVVMTCILFLF